jgi:hypothetical protein
MMMGTSRRVFLERDDLILGTVVRVEILSELAAGLLRQWRACFELFRLAATKEFGHCIDAQHAAVVHIVIDESRATLHQRAVVATNKVRVWCTNSSLQVEEGGVVVDTHNTVVAARLLDSDCKRCGNLFFFYFNYSILPDVA